MKVTWLTWRGRCCALWAVWWWVCRPPLGLVSGGPVCWWTGPGRCVWRPAVVVHQRCSLGSSTRRSNRCPAANAWSTFSSGRPEPQRSAGYTGSGTGGAQVNSITHWDSFYAAFSTSQLWNDREKAPWKALGTCRFPAPPMWAGQRSSSQLSHQSF